MWNEYTIIYCAKWKKIMSPCTVLVSFVNSDIIYVNVLMIFKHLQFLDMTDIYYIKTKKSINLKNKWWSKNQQVKTFVIVTKKQK